MAFLMKYDGAYEAIQVVISTVELVKDTGVGCTTHGKGNNVAYSYLMEARTKGPDTRKHELTAY